MFFTRLACYFILRENRKRQVVYLVLSIFVSYVIPIREMPLKIDVVFMAIPFYIIGFFCKEYRILDKIDNKILFAFICFVISAIMVRYQGFSEMNLRNFGNYPALYYPLCSISLFAYVLLFSSIKTRSTTLEYLSNGTIVTMAFQGFTNLIVTTVVQSLDVQLPIPFTICCVLLYAPLSFLLTLPFMFALKRYLPTAIGNRK